VKGQKNVGHREKRVVRPRIKLQQLKKFILDKNMQGGGGGKGHGRDTGTGGEAGREEKPRKKKLRAGETQVWGATLTPLELGQAIGQSPSSPDGGKQHHRTQFCRRRVWVHPIEKKATGKFRGGRTKGRNFANDGWGDVGTWEPVGKRGRMRRRVGSSLQGEKTLLPRQNTQPGRGPLERTKISSPT